MKGTFLTVMKKEMIRFFTDRRILFTTMILPGLMIYILYSLLGTAMISFFEPEDGKMKVACLYMPDDINEMFSKDLYEKIYLSSESQVKQYKKNIKNKKTDVLIIFPKDFPDNTDGVPNVEIFYNSSDNNSNKTYRCVSEILSKYEEKKVNLFDINKRKEDNDKDIYNLSTDEESTARYLSSMLPFMLLLFLYSGCSSVAPESIAGEKERGTITSLLITPAKRSCIALGKIVALALIAVCSGLSSGLGIMFSLPKIAGQEMNIAGNMYSVSDYVMLMFIILSTALVLVTVISLLSAFAGSVKEANTYVTPLMILIMIVGVTAVFGNGAKQFAGYYFIPVYNSVLSMVSILSFEESAVRCLITVFSNMFTAVLGAVLLAKMFDNEYIMFRK